MWCRAGDSEKSSFRRQGPIGAKLDGAIDRSGLGNGKGSGTGCDSGNTLSSLVESYKRGDVRQNGAAAVEARPNVGSEPYSGRAEARL
jgi:hypothetical protein